jgi:predicted ribonuclease YlaK
MAKKQSQSALTVAPAVTLQSHGHNRLKLTLNDMATFQPLTDNQRKFFDLYKDGAECMLLHGVAGTGKTFIALYRALEEVLDRGNPYQQVVLVRSAVPSREIGHLPGDEKEKTDVYTAPYIDICSRLFYNRTDAYHRLQEQKAINFLITSFVRGITLDDSIVIVDECQNMTDMELNSIMTRIGDRSKIIFCGDFRQTDLYKKSDMSGLLKFMAIADAMPSFRTLEFGVNDIVRSDLVREYILARMDYESKHVA